MSPEVIAALISAAGSIGSSLLNKPKQIDAKQISQFSPEQQRLFSQISKQLSPEMIQQLYGPIDTETLRDRFQQTTAEPAKEDFFQNIIPELQEMFTGMGGGGGDAEQFQLASAGQRLESDLARQFQGLLGSEEDKRRQAISGMLGARPVATQPFTTGGRDFSGLSNQLGGLAGDFFGRWLQNRGMNAQQAQASPLNTFQPTTELPEFNPRLGMRNG